jgi:hypothetical protein
MIKNRSGAKNADALWNTNLSYLLLNAHLENGVDKYFKMEWFYGYIVK